MICKLHVHWAKLAANRARQADILPLGSKRLAIQALLFDDEPLAAMFQQFMDDAVPACRGVDPAERTAVVVEKQILHVWGRQHGVKMPPCRRSATR